MIAMALSCSPKLLIADEPTTALDVTTQAQIIELLHTLQREEDMAMIFVTHDLGVIADVADDVAVMYAGQIVEHSAAADIFARPRHPYTEALLHSIPQLTPKGEPLHAIPGMVPRPDQFPTGCRFAPRCSYAQDACAEAPVPLRASSVAGEASVGTGTHSRANVALARCVRQDDLTIRPAPSAPHERRPGPANRSRARLRPPDRLSSRRRCSRWPTWSRISRSGAGCSGRIQRIGPGGRPGQPQHPARRDAGFGGRERLRQVDAGAGWSIRLIDPTAGHDRGQRQGHHLSARTLAASTS